MEDPDDPNFYDLSNTMTKSPLALGYNKLCPRDGLLHCSIVDALDQVGRAGLATHYLSWTWGYKARPVQGGMQRMLGYG